jgi:ABC-2 type transport system permease protein
MSEAAGTARTEVANAAAGSIYDLGYQTYDGPRLGRRHAIRALFMYSLRGCFGIGRGGRAKIVPLALAIFALLPAVVAVGVAALVIRVPTGGGGGGGGGPAMPITYGTFFSYIQTIPMLFCAAQAPELVGRDQRYHVLPLYFSRALRRSDYAIAKLASLLVALLAVFLVPEAVIFVGSVLAASDVPTAFFENLPSAPPVLAIGLASAAVLGGIGLAVAAFTPRRAYATAAIIAVFTVPSVVVAIVNRFATGDAGRLVVLLSPGEMLEGLNAFFFGRASANRVLVQADLPGVAYLAAAVITAVGCLLVLLQRYRRIAA